MARNLIAMGATEATVDEASLAQDVASVLGRIAGLEPEVVLRGKGDQVVAEVALDNDQVTELLLEVVRVAESNGLKLPREFALLVKQALYFDRYTKLLAPDLDPLRDERVAVGEYSSDVSDRTCLTGMFGTFVGKFSMFPSAPATWDLDVQSLATAVTLPVSVSMTVEELRKIIADRLGIAAQNQMWHDSETLETLEGITQMTVVHAGEPLKPLPKRFAIRLTSSRERFKTGYSSSFTIEYRIRADVEKGEMVLEPWRKNDHDTLLYNTKQKTLKLQKSHWMAGTQETTQALTRDPLADLVSRWRGCYLEPSATPFWKASSEPLPEQRAHRPYGDLDRKPQTVPDYAAVPGWFVAPDGCEEVETDLEIGNKTVRRMLVQDGRPVRLAMSQCRVGTSHLHEDIEEYDAEVRELQDSDSLQSDD
eukprot:symbB.v1.2.010479.t2/scaffold679.1/size173156/15